jgi:hypothetical protein
MFVYTLILIFVQTNFHPYGHHQVLNAVLTLMRRVPDDACKGEN